MVTFNYPENYIRRNVVNPISPSEIVTNPTPDTPAEAPRDTRYRDQLNSINREIRKYERAIEDLQSGKAKSSQAEKLIQQYKAEVRALKEARDNLKDTGTAFFTTKTEPQTQTPRDVVITDQGQGVSKAFELQTPAEKQRTAEYTANLISTKEGVIENVRQDNLQSTIRPYQSSGSNELYNTSSLSTGTYRRDSTTVPRSVSGQETQYLPNQGLVNYEGLRSQQISLGQESIQAFKRGGLINVAGGTTLALLSFGGGFGKTVLGGIEFFSPYSFQQKKFQIPIVDPTIEGVKFLTSGDYIRYAKQEPFEFAGGVAGGVVGGRIVNTGLRKFYDITTANSFSKQSIILGTAEAFGKRGLTPAERGVFKPKLENVDLYETPFGVIEIIQKQPEAPVLPKPSQTTISKVSETPSDIEPVIESPDGFSSGQSSAGISFAKLDLSGPKFDMSGRGRFNLAGGTQSLARSTGPSLELEYAPSQILIIEEIPVVKTIPKSSLQDIGTGGLLLRENILQTESRIGLDIQTGNLQSPISQSKLQQSLFPDTEQKQTSSSLQRLKIDTQQDLIPIQTNVQQQRQNQAQELLQEQKQRQEQRQRQILETENLLEPITQSKKKKDKKGQQFKLFVKRKGVDVLQGIGEDTDLLFKRGFDINRVTASASLKVVDEENKAILPKNIPSDFALSRKSPGRVIQKRERRISTAGEKFEITRKGIQASRYKGRLI